MSSSTRPDDHRQKWDRAEYEERAALRLQDEQADASTSTARTSSTSTLLRPTAPRRMLQQRDYRVDLDSRLGKSQVITRTSSAAHSGGYYCNVCDCVVKDSINFLDHINGKKHQRNLGMSMRVERSSLDQVKNRFDLNKRKKEEQKKEYDMEERLKEIREEEAKQKEYRRERRREKKRKLEQVEPDDADSANMAALMGFSGFGSSKK